MFLLITFRTEWQTVAVGELAGATENLTPCRPMGVLGVQDVSVRDATVVVHQNASL